MSGLLEVRGLRKRYGRVQALDGVDLEVGPGEIVGLLGPNGAGKTTTLSCVLGLVRPDGGEIRLFGRPATAEARPRLHRRLGALLEPAFYPYLSGRENLRLLAAPLGLEGQVDPLLERVGLEGAARRPVKGYSTGMRQRLGLAAALLGDPEFLLLDEPTRGLDPEGRRTLLDLLRRLREEGRGILLASHVLPEVEGVADRVVILHRGRVRGAGSVEELLRARWLRVRVEPAEAALARLQAAPWIPQVRPGPDGTLEVALPPEEGARLNRYLAEAGLFAAEIVPFRPGLEEVFVELTQREDGA